MTNKKKYRKNSTLAYILVFVLIAALAGTFIGTIAKYIKQGEGSDSAGGAKFDFNIPGTIDLFKDSYLNVEADTDDKNIIAPGTGGSSAFVVTGTSEVAYKVSATVTVVYSEEWNGYAPLRFSLDGDSWTDLAGFQQALSTALTSEILAPNTAYSSTQTIYWEWPFYVSPENDVKDTAIGELAATGKIPSVTVTVEVVATQID